MNEEKTLSLAPFKKKERCLLISIPYSTKPKPSTIGTVCSQCKIKVVITTADLVELLNGNVTGDYRSLNSIILHFCQPTLFEGGTYLKNEDRFGIQRLTGKSLRTSLE